MLRKSYSKIAGLISGNSKSFNVEQRIFNIAVFIACIVSALSIAINIQLNLPKILHAIIGLGGLVLLFIYIRSRIGQKFHMWGFIFTSLIILTGSWLYNEGLSGSINYLFILAFIIFLSISERKWHVIISMLLFANIIGLYSIYYIFPDWIHPYASQEVRESDMIFTYAYVVLFSAIVFSALRRNYENEKNTVEHQKNELETTNKQITDSILYAKEIQQALLQSCDSIEAYFQNYFIFWEPKDIVSGDFYSFRKFPNNPDKIVYTVSDCTGHGVPGALITMLGLSFFNELFLTNQEFKPSEILHILRNKIKSSLRHGTDYYNNRDGMDMAVCIVDCKKRKLEYAGANRPLIIIRGNEIIEKKGSRMTVGLSPISDKKFDNHQIDLLPGDMIYLFTDGYADQFGDRSGNKYYTARLKKLLLNNSHLPMHEQGEMLRKEFFSWKGENEQTDDVLVLGIKPNL